MSGMRSLTSIDELEYDRIEAAMSESGRGRWFLSEYARRNRTADTDVLLGAIARLESAVTGDREADRVVRMRGDLMDMAHAIARTKAEIAAISTADHDQSRLGIASVALDGIIRATERATSDILGAAEDVQESAWTLRESGSDPAICDVLDRRATEIYTACSFQDLTAQRTARIIHTLRYLEERLAAMIAIWGGEEVIPSAPGTTVPVVDQDLDQSDVDRFIDMEGTSPAMERGRTPPLPSGDSLDGDVDFVDAAPEAVIVAPVPPVQASDASDEGGADDETVHEDKVEDDVVGETTADEAPAPEKTDIATAFADIDGLSDEEKLALFS